MLGAPTPGDWPVRGLSADAITVVVVVVLVLVVVVVVGVFEGFVTGVFFLA
jgi:hypothetical protein